ncbi:hypothetical protein HCBAA847_1453 [Helicobacter cinaedi CCUG 18818 = ATCC BAA-847]|uniref:Uncharacterized protein n=1 Tax=Helicobacter cinaedi CCUG 18818 = ATCC BAA-847 TaxID=537971 RepID=A0AAI8QHF5_9HELI|nr:hypothetical protein [Helicobacter cinaedi]BAM32683.1 hypothetical protein HCBAA847_1453 [Helicobacter cinaedi CCUG 18818 = ATCC BAA-847]
MDGWGFLSSAAIIQVLICLVAVNIIVILILFCYRYRIRKYINQYPTLFCLGSILGNSLGTILHIIKSRGVDNFVESHFVSIFYLPLITPIHMSLIFIVLFLIIYYKNPHFKITPSSKTRSFKFGFLFFSIVSSITFCITKAT